MAIENPKEDKSSQPKVAKKFLKSFVDIRSWSSYDELSNNTKNVLGSMKKFFVRDNKERFHETYEEALSRLNLTEQDQITRKRYFLLFSLFYFAVAIALIYYGFSMLIGHHLFAMVVSFILAFITLILAYRESFWYMQMSKRKLGCKFSEWISFVFKRK